MKVILAGSRNIIDEFTVMCCADSIYFEKIDEVIGGGARGVDSFAPLLAERRQAKYVEFKADWGRLGKKAGYLRNLQMGAYADALIAVWDGKSRGTRHMIDIMLDLSKPVHVFIVKQNEDSNAIRHSQPTNL